MNEPDGGALLLRKTLVVFVVLAVVAAIVSRRWEERQHYPNPGSCKSNLRNLGTALEMYASDNRGYYPEALQQLAPRYQHRLPICPQAGRDTYSQGYRASVSPATFTLVCEGHYHGDIGYPPNFPQYTSSGGLSEQY